MSGAPSVTSSALDDGERALRRRTHVTIDRVTRDIDPRMHLNTAVSALMELVNEIYTFAETRGVRPAGRDDEPPAVIVRPETAAVLRDAIESLVLLISPFTPHMAEELWERLGHPEGVDAAGWPSFDEAAAREESVEIPVQINGKLRARITVPAGSDDADIERAARGADQVRTHLANVEVVKVIVANGRLVNIVVRPGKGS
jgi:leucyl-tRNA synthetase